MTHGSNDSSWPGHRLAHGILELGGHVDEARGRRVAAKCHVQYGIMKLICKAGGQREFDKAGGHGEFERNVLQAPIADLVIKVLPHHYDMFVLSARQAPDVEVYAFTTDQTARNKWLAGGFKSIDLLSKYPSTHDVDTIDAVLGRVLLTGAFQTQSMCAMYMSP
jgi:hypothetical protein